MSVNNPISTTLIIYSSKKYWFVIKLSTSQDKDKNPFWKLSVSLLFLVNPNKSVYRIALQQYILYLGAD